nr:FmdB family zinc ribbon protein [Actinopolymorpha rutila]
MARPPSTGPPRPAKVFRPCTWRVAVPTYQYSCVDCGEQLEAVQKFSDDPLTVCPACSGKLRKVFSAVGVVFKGSGFYRNDSRSSQQRSGASGNGSSGSKDSGSKESGGSGKESASSSSDSGSGKSSDSSGNGSGSKDSGSKAGTASGSGSSNAA